MSQLFIGKPDYQNEPDYCAYFFELVPEIGLLDALKQSLEQTISFIASLTPEQWQFAYQKNKWTTAQVVRHTIATGNVVHINKGCFQNQLFT